MSKVTVVVGGGFGSEAKGAVTGVLTKRLLAEGDSPLCVRVGGPNAGHTVYDAEGREWKFRQIPVGAALDLGVDVVIAAGSEIDPLVLEEELVALREAGYNGRVYVDAQCTVIEDKHKEQEGHFGGHLTQRIGSTGKGIGAARADRIWRTATIWRDWDHNLDVETTDTAALLVSGLKAGQPVIIEAAQGFGLGLHQGYYPTCTSADGRIIDALADAGISPWAPWVTELEPWVVCRTYPIRVAGNSGELKNELTWEELAERSGGYIQPEHTTVTKKVRRIGEWDPDLARRAIEANGGDACRVALSFLDYIEPKIAGMTNMRDITGAWPEVAEFLRAREDEMRAHIRMVGTGPDSYAWV